MKNLRTGIVFMVTAFVALSSCKKEKPLEPITTPPVVSPINEGPSNTELISGNYTISLAVVNGDTVSSSDQWMDQTYVINEDGTGMQLLHVENDSSTHTFEKPLEWYFGENDRFNKKLPTGHMREGRCVKKQSESDSDKGFAYPVGFTSISHRRKDRKI